MFNKKTLRLFSVMLCIILFSQFACVQAEETEIKYGNEVNVLKQLGIIEQETDVNSEVTRGAFVSAAVKLMGIGETGTELQFSDVSKDNPYYSGIAAAYSAGLVSGYSGEIFLPDGIVTAAQAIKILTCVTGHNVIAESKGGWPSGYLTAATDAGILKGINPEEPLKWNAAAKLIYNTMNINLLQNVTYPGEEYREAANKTPLNGYMKIEKAEGIIDANSYTSLTSSKGLGKGKISVNNKIYECDLDYLGDYIGHHVLVYYSEDESGLYRIKAAEFKKKAEVIKVYGEDVSPDSTSVSLVYYCGNKKLSKSIVSAPSVIYNGKYLGNTLTNALLSPAEGSVTLVDSDNNGSAEVVFITEAEIYVADTILSSIFKIKDKYNKGMLDLSAESDKTIEIYKNSQPADFTAIKKHDVLSVMKSKDGKYVRVEISSAKAKGKVLEKDSDSVVLTDSEYKITNQNKFLASEIEAGKITTFYLTVDGKIAGISSMKDSMLYGYLLAAMPEGKGINADTEGSMRVFEATGGLKTYKFAEKIYFNDKLANASGIKYTGKILCDILAPGGVADEQLLKYILNENNEITHIYTSVNNTAEPFAAKEDAFTLDYDYPTTNTLSYCPPTARQPIFIEESGGVISNNIACSNAVGILLPNLEDGEKMIDREDEIVSFIPTTQWSDFKKLDYLQVYDMDEEHMASVLITKGGSANTPPQNGYFIVDKLTETLDEDGYTVKKLYGMRTNSYVSYELNEEKIEDVENLKLECGDVLRILTDSTGIIKIWKVFSANPSPDRSGFLMDANGYDDWFMGKGGQNYSHYQYLYWDNYHASVHLDPVGVTDKQLLVKIASPKLKVNTKIIPFAPWCKVTVYDQKTNSIRVGSYEDIQPDDEKQTVLVYIEYEVALEVFVINREKEAEISWNANY